MALRAATPVRLTARQQAVLEAFRDLTAKLGEPPSVRDVAEKFKIQVSAMHRHLSMLAEKGLLELHDGSMRLPGAAVMPVPILGRVPAGPLHEAIEAPDGYVSCPAAWGRSRELFALRVRGDSMEGAGILNDDVVICAKADRAQDGEIVVAMVDGDVTVKRLGRAAGGPALLPANAKYKPIPLRGEVKLSGKVLGVFRDLES
jgi:repressor LexA